MRGSAELCNKIKRVLLPNKIQSEKYLKPGDHIYTWRQANAKHHGIYVGGGKVIHLARAAGLNHTICPTCADDQPRALDVDGVVSTSLEVFLSGGGLFRFEYGVNPALFLAKFWELGTCTLASSDPSEIVEERASFLLNNGSADYYRYINNSEDFAIYCKTGLVVVDRINFRKSWQTVFFLAVTVAVYLSLQQITAANFTGLAARYVGTYCIYRLAPDIGARPNVIKVDQVQRLPQVDKILASCSGFRVVQSYIDLVLRILMFGFFFPLVSSLWSETLASIIFFYWAILQRRLLPNKIQKEQLKPGDHIYTYRRAYTYSHHGIYMGNRKVIHLDRGEDPISGGGEPTKYHVESCCINCFLAGGELYLYKYGVNLAFFIATTRGGTCTTCVSIPSLKLARCRASLLLKHRDFGPYSLFNNNCEDFIVYCKTGLLSRRTFINHGKNGQIASLLAVFVAFVINLSGVVPTSSYIDVSAAVYLIYSLCRFIFDDTEVGKANRVPLYELADEFRRRSDSRMSKKWWLFGVFVVIIICPHDKTVILCFQKLKVLKEALVQVMQCVLSAY